MNKNKAIAGIVAVVAIGALVAALFGTEKGSKLRKKLKKKGMEAGEHLKDKMSRYAEQRM